MTDAEKQQAYEAHRQWYREECKRLGLLPPDKIANPSKS